MTPEKLLHSFRDNAVFKDHDILVKDIFDSVLAGNIQLNEKGEAHFSRQFIERIKEGCLREGLKKLKPFSDPKLPNSLIKLVYEAIQSATPLESELKIDNTRFNAQRGTALALDLASKDLDYYNSVIIHKRPSEGEEGKKHLRKETFSRRLEETQKRLSSKPRRTLFEGSAILEMHLAKAENISLFAKNFDAAEWAELCLIENVAHAINEGSLESFQDKDGNIQVQPSQKTQQNPQYQDNSLHILGLDIFNAMAKGAPSGITTKLKSFRGTSADQARNLRLGEKASTTIGENKHTRKKSGMLRKILSRFM